MICYGYTIKNDFIPMMYMQQFMLNSNHKFSAIPHNKNEPTVLSKYLQTRLFHSKLTFRLKYQVVMISLPLRKFTAPEYDLICLAWPKFSLIFSLNWLKVCGARWDNSARKMSKNLRNKHVIAK